MTKSSGVTCIVQNCGKSTGKNRGLPFHKLPKDQNRRLKWLQILHRVDLLDTAVKSLDNRKICNDHFTNEQFRDNKNRKSGLLPMATPFFDPVYEKQVITAQQNQTKRKNNDPEAAASTAVGDHQYSSDDDSEEDQKNSAGNIVPDEVDEETEEILEVMLVHLMELHIPKELVRRIHAEDKENMEEFYPLSVNGKRGGVRLVNSEDSVIMKIEGQSSKETECLCVLSELQPKELLNFEEVMEVTEVIEEPTSDELAVLQEPLKQVESMPFLDEDQQKEMGGSEEASNREISPFMHSCVLCNEALDVDEVEMENHVTACHNMAFKDYLLVAREYCHLCREKLTVSVHKHAKEKHNITSEQYFKLAGKSSAKKAAHFDTNINYTCSRCEKTFENDSELKNHMLGKHSRSKSVFKFKCKLCAKKVRTEDMLSIHELKEHPTVDESEQYVCTHCNGRYDKKKDYYNHIPVCTSHPVYVCFTCDVIFPSQQEYEDHITHHPEKKRFICDLCGASFAFKNTFYVHRKYKHQEKPVSPMFKCSTCGKSFETLGLLNKHTARTHANLRNHICEQCGSAFKSRQHLRAHVLKIHDNIYPFYCETCGLGFSSSAGVKKHRCTGIRFKSRAEKTLFLAKHGPDTQLKGADVKVESVLDLAAQEGILIEENVLIQTNDPTLFLQTLDPSVCINPVQ